VLTESLATTRSSLTRQTSIQNTLRDQVSSQVNSISEMQGRLFRLGASLTYCRAVARAYVRVWALGVKERNLSNDAIHWANLGDYALSQYYTGKANDLT